MDYLKELIDDEIVTIASDRLEYTLYSTAGAGIKHRALGLLEDCGKLRGLIVMALWAKVLTREEFYEYSSLIADMTNDAHDLAFFGHFM